MIKNKQELAAEIIQRKMSGTTMRELRSEFHVANSTVYRLIRAFATVEEKRKIKQCSKKPVLRALSMVEARDIRRLHRKKVLIKKIAAKYEVSLSTVFRIIAMKTYKK